jgi:hypothetical protein
MIPQYTITEFKMLKAHEIMKLKSCEIVADGEHLMTVIIPPAGSGSYVMDNIKTEAQYLAARSNIAGGVDIDEVRIKETVQ